MCLWGWSLAVVVAAPGRAWVAKTRIRFGLTQVALIQRIEKPAPSRGGWCIASMQRVPRARNSSPGDAAGALLHRRPAFGGSGVLRQRCPRRDRRAEDGFTQTIFDAMTCRVLSRLQFRLEGMLSCDPLESFVWADGRNHGELSWRCFSALIAFVRNAAAVKLDSSGVRRRLSRELPTGPRTAQRVERVGVEGAQ